MLVVNGAARSQYWLCPPRASFNPLANDSGPVMSSAHLCCQRAGASALFSMFAQHPDVGSIVREDNVDGSGGFMAQDPAR